MRITKKSLRFAGAAMVLCSAGSLLVPGRAMAEENMTPYLPGGTTGVPVGAAPPPGLYFTEDLFGRFTVSARYLDSVEAKNTVNASFFHLALSFKI